MATMAEEKPVQMKRHRHDISDSEDEEIDVSPSPPKKVTMGTQTSFIVTCVKRKAKGSKDSGSEKGENSEEEGEKSKGKKWKCRYGNKCYQTSADHLEKYEHPPNHRPKRQPGGAKKKESPRPPSHINVQVLLAKKYNEESDDPTGWWVSEKLDGVRAYWNGRAFYSRLGNVFVAPNWFIKDLPKDMPLDGELFGGRGMFQSTVHIVKTGTDDEWKKIKYHVFDAPTVKAPFEQRIEGIKEYFKNTDVPSVTVVDHYKCTGAKQIAEELKKMIALGAEGLMIRKPRSEYVRSRSDTLLKIKKFYDAEAVVIGHEPGKGRFCNATGALRCRMENGKEFSVGSGMSDKDRMRPPKIGSIITYKFQEYTNSGSPRFPSFLGIRIDMDKPKDAIVPKKPKADADA